MNTPDQPISLAIAIVGVILSLALPKRFALVPLALSMCLYPSTLIMPPQNLSLTPQRLIAGVLLVRCVLQPSVRSMFRWRMVDTAAVVYYLSVTVSQLMTAVNFGAALNNRLGFFLSAMVPFWCVRLLITDRTSLYNLLKGWLFAAVPLALLGVYQMNTGDSPYFQLMQHGILWKQQPNTKWDMRNLLGFPFFRASAPFLQFIMFGWFFALLFTPTTNLFWEKRKVTPWGVAWLFLPVGVASSIAAGPMSFAAVSLLLACLFPWRKHWRTGFGVAAAMYVALLFFARRSPMEFLAEFGIDPISSWYRVGLQKFVLYGGGMANHWLAGYGEIPEAFGRYHDLCIHWVWLLVLHGVMGLVGFYGFIAASAWSLWKGKEHAESTEDQYLLWSLMSTLLATLLGMLLVALFSEMYFIYHMFLGVVANANLMVGARVAVRHVDVLAEQAGRPVLLRFGLRPGEALALVRRSQAGHRGVT